ncbi:MAG: hypothetical protein JNL80_07665 [Phycisphaerae bacterium]|jgi:hypothetical protein|nr:hypothetical protein [Phycisphaerae bacterium]
MRSEEQLSRLATLAVVAVALIRSTISIAPQVRFDTDPGLNAMPYVGFGPTGSMVLDVILLMAAAMAFTAEARAGRRVHLGLVALAALPGIAVAWHGLSNGLDLFRGSTWLAAAIGGVAAMHLGRDPANRRLLVTGCASVVAMLVVRGAEQIWIEHAATVSEFERNRARIFAQYGWDPLGSAARSYERRLRQPEATGWFALSNLFSAAMAFGVVFFGATSLNGFVRKVRDLSVLVCLLLTIGAAVLLVINGSKGANGVTVLGAALAIVGLSRWRRLMPWVGLAMILVVALAPLLRGLFAEGFANEKSLLFRAHYLEGALRALPEAMPLGLGPDGFQDAYVRLKPERSPEDVMSTHAMAIDWVVLLGPLGLAWVALVGRMLWKRPVEVAGAEYEAPGRGRLAILLLALLSASAVAEAPILNEWWALARLVALGAFAITFLAIDAALRSASLAPAIAPALAAAMLAVVAQGQIEMIFFQPGMVVWVFVLLGALAALPADEPTGPARRLSLGALVATAYASIVLAFGVAPQMAQDQRMDEAIAVLAPVADLREAWPGLAQEVQRGQSGPAAKAALAAMEAAGAGPLAREAAEAVASSKSVEERIRDVGSTLQRFESTQRLAAAELLLKAREVHPTNWQPERAAIDQLVAASREGGRLDVERPSFAQAMHLSETSFEHWRSPRFAAMRSDLRYELARAKPSSDTIASALAAVNDALAVEPFAASRHIARGDLLAASGEFAQAIASWRRAIEVDAQRELDPLTQLSPKERAAIETRIATGERAATAPSSAYWPLVP